MKFVNTNQCKSWMKEVTGKNRTFQRLRNALEDIHSLEERNQTLLWCALIFLEIVPNEAKVWEKLRYHFFNYYRYEIYLLCGYKEEKIGKKIVVNDIDQFAVGVQWLIEKKVFKEMPKKDWLDLLYSILDTGYSRSTFEEKLSF